MLKKFSLGTGDRFGQQGKAQLKAMQKAAKEYNILITPVWNKSHREHQIIGTGPEDVRIEADKAASELGWENEYYVDADHITKETVDAYLEFSNFFTIDVAEYIGEKGNSVAREKFLLRNKGLIGRLEIPGIEKEFKITKRYLKQWANQYFHAIQQARNIYEYIKERKSKRSVFEISIDEVQTSQSPLDLFFLLKTIAEEEISIHTIAPKFTGEFYKGIDYVGDISRFETEFAQNLLVIEYAIDRFNLSSDLKMSIHSGSDKFSLYPRVRRLLKKHDAGVHLKTAGTTWLEEMIGLAVAGGEGLSFVKKIYKEAYYRYEELTQPYKSVIAVEEKKLPDPKLFDDWSAEKIVAKLEHTIENPDLDLQLRQFLHCSYKIAAEEKNNFIPLLKQHEDQIGSRVTQNLYSKHIIPLFGG